MTDNNEALKELGLNLGGAAVVGVAVGFFAKKAIKIALFLAGAALVLLFVTEFYMDAELVSGQSLEAVGSQSISAVKSGLGIIFDRFQDPKLYGGIAGFVIGWKMG